MSGAFLFGGGFWLILAAALVGVVVWLVVAARRAPLDTELWDGGEDGRLAEVHRFPPQLRVIDGALSEAGEQAAAADFAFPPFVPTVPRDGGRFRGEFLPDRDVGRPA